MTIRYSCSPVEPLKLECIDESIMWHMKGKSVRNAPIYITFPVLLHELVDLSARLKSKSPYSCRFPVSESCYVVLDTYRSTIARFVSDA